MVKPSASTLAFPGQKPDLGWFEVRGRESKKDSGTNRIGDGPASPVKSLASSSWRLVAWLWPSWEDSYPENVCSASRDASSTHEALQRSQKGVPGPCLLWPTFSIVNIPLLLCLGLTCCWVSHTISIKLCFLCATPGVSQLYLLKACTKLECISKRKQKAFLMSTALFILQNDLVCSVLFWISKLRHAPKKPSSLKFHKLCWISELGLFCVLQWEVEIWISWVNLGKAILSQKQRFMISQGLMEAFQTRGKLGYWTMKYFDYMYTCTFCFRYGP